ncbi:MAG: ACT domain-containing protein [Myxococcales bacterium]|nr:ACT domain-containing protein [Myxococcales bacterium]
MARIVTHAEVAQVPDGGELIIEPGAELTPLAKERATARRIRVAVGSPSVGEDTLQVAARVAEQILVRLGKTDESVVEKVASEVMAALGGVTAVESAPGLPPSADYCSTYLESERSRARRKVVITATGQNQKGVVAKLTAILADLGCDILDISQTLVGDYFTMLVIVDMAEMQADFAQLKSSLQQAAASMGFHVMLMHEDLVRSLHRV